jgi:hypothetical protein
VTTQPRKRTHAPIRYWVLFDRPSVRRVLLQRIMNTILVKRGDIDTDIQRQLDQSGFCGTSLENYRTVLSAISVSLHSVAMRTSRMFRMRQWIGRFTVQQELPGPDFRNTSFR